MLVPRQYPQGAVVPSFPGIPCISMRGPFYDRDSIHSVLDGYYTKDGEADDGDSRQDKGPGS